MNDKGFRNYSSKPVLNDNLLSLNKIVWHNINKEGYLVESSKVIKNQPSVFIYEKISGETRYYIQQ